MFPLALLLALGLATPTGSFGPSSLLRVEMAAPLHGALMGKLGGMSAAGEGVYNEDVTTLLAPYFPKGQTLEDTRKTVHDESLGELHAFKGRTGPQDGTMFVTRFQLMDRTSSEVFVVVHFGFSRTAPSSDLTLDHFRAYLRSNSM